MRAPASLTGEPAFLPNQESAPQIVRVPESCSLCCNATPLWCLPAPPCSLPPPPPPSRRPARGEGPLGTGGVSGRWARTSTHWPALSGLSKQRPQLFPSQAPAGAASTPPGGPLPWAPAAAASRVRGAETAFSVVAGQVYLQGEELGPLPASVAYSTPWPERAPWGPDLQAVCAAPRPAGPGGGRGHAGAWRAGGACPHPPGLQHAGCSLPARQRQDVAEPSQLHTHAPVQPPRATPGSLDMGLRVTDTGLRVTDTLTPNVGQ